MQSVIDLVLSLVPNPGDRVLYSAIYDAVPEVNRRHIRNALKTLKADGRVKAENTYEDGAVKFELVRQNVS